LNWIKKLQGKSMDRSTGVYSKPEESGEPSTAYIKAYDKLRIFGVDDVRQLRRELEGSDDRIKELAQKTDALAETIKILQQELRRLEKRRV